MFTLLNFSETAEDVNAILLSDIIDDIVKISDVTKTYKMKKMAVVIKIDIESFECRAFLGSPKIFSNPRVYIPYIVMEWTYLLQESTVSVLITVVK